MARDFSSIKKAILRELSENSRASVADLSKRLKCSRNTLTANMSALEKEFGLHYTVEFNKKNLGFVQNHVWEVKFGIKPPDGAVKRIFKEDTMAQLVLETDGDFDLVVKVLSDSSESYVKWALGTAVKLLEYRPVIRPSFISLIHTGFVPVLNELIAKFDASDLGIDQLDRRIIMLLNENARMSYTDMSKRLNVDMETIRYRARKISKSDVIKRFTMTMRKPPTSYNMAFFINYTLAPGVVKRYNEAYRYYIGIDEAMPVINSFQYLALTSGSSLLFGIGCFKDEESAIRQAVMRHKEIYAEDSPEISFARIRRTIKGSLPVRNINIRKEFVPISW